MIDHENSLGQIKTNSSTINKVLKVRLLAKQFSELRSSRCFIMFGVDFCLESTGTPRGQSLVRCFHIDMVHTTVVPRIDVHLSHESSNEN